MTRYDSYRMSEIPCLGSVPSHWKSSKFKFHHFEEDDTVGECSDDYPLLSLTKEGVVFRDVESGKGKFPASFENYKAVHPGSLIFCLFDIDETPRTIGLSNHLGMITGAYKLFRTTHDLNPRFSFYTFLVIDNVKGLKPYYTGLRKVVRPETFKSLEFSLPPLHEQEQIVGFLDRKTTLIDSLIEKTVRKIELLKEKRTSLINEVVTKGLNPDVEMKDSGVEWIGEIPSHWVETKLKNLGQVTLGKMLTKEDKGGFSLRPYLRSFNVQVETVDVSDVKEMWFSDHEMSELRLVKGDLLFNEGGDVGRTSIWNEELPECYIQNSVNRVRFDGNSRYFLYVSGLHHGTGYYDSQVNRVSIPHLTKEKLENVLFSSPPTHEQEQIVEYLDEQTSIIDSTITTEEKRIELLKEYRQSLISEVVTGKIKVA